ncbi:hypothetical protein Tco_1230322 [Tanacetum coccineum]
MNSTNMAVLESCAKHNMVAYLEKTDGNTDFHEIIDFLTRSPIHYALTVSTVVSTIFVEQFWMSAKSKIIKNVRCITAKVAGKPVNISEASIRSDLLFDDADGIASLHNQAIFDAIQGDLTILTFNKALFSPQWRFLFHTMNHCISSKTTYWDQIPTNIATTLKNVPVPLDHFPINASTSKVFSFMVKKGKHFSGNVTPLFESMLVQPTEDEGEASERQSEPQPTPSPPHTSADQHETQPDPSPRPLPTISIPDSIPKGSGGNHKRQSSNDSSLSGNEDGLTLQSVYNLFISLCTQVTDQAKEIKHLKAHINKLKKKANPVITHHKAWMKSVSMKQRLARKKKWKQKESVSKQGRKSAKSTPIAHTDQVFDDVDVNDAMDYMETEDAHYEERTSAEKGVSTEDKVSTDKPEVSTNKPKVSTDQLDVSTDKPNEGTAKPDEGIAKVKDGDSEESATPTDPTTTSTPTTTIFRDDETIAEFLISMSQNKAKQKGVEIKDAEDSDRPRATSTRSVLTLKPLPKIDPKDKGKKVLKEEAESEGVNEAERKFTQLERDAEVARKLNEEMQAELERERIAQEEATKDALIMDYDDIQARIEADRILAARIQEEEREKFIVEERAKFLHDTIAAQRRFLAQQ